MQKKIAIILGVILLAVLIGFVGSNWIGSPNRPDDVTETEAERAARLGLGADVEGDVDDSTVAPTIIDARPLTGEEGATVDGTRELAPNEGARVEDRDYFEGLEDLDAAQPVDDGPATGPADTPTAPAEPVVERPDEDLLNELDTLE